MTGLASAFRQTQGEPSRLCVVTRRIRLMQGLRLSRAKFIMRPISAGVKSRRPWAGRPDGDMPETLLEFRIVSPRRHEAPGRKSPPRLLSCASFGLGTRSRTRWLGTQSELGTIGTVSDTARLCPAPVSPACYSCTTSFCVCVKLSASSRTRYTPDESLRRSRESDPVVR